MFRFFYRVASCLNLSHTTSQVVPYTEIHKTISPVYKNFMAVAGWFKGSIDPQPTKLYTVPIFSWFDKPSIFRLVQYNNKKHKIFFQNKFDCNACEKRSTFKFINAMCQIVIAIELNCGIISKFKNKRLLPLRQQICMTPVCS